MTINTWNSKDSFKSGIQRSSSRYLPERGDTIRDALLELFIISTQINVINLYISVVYAIL